MSQAPPVDAERPASPEGDISLGRELRRAREVRGISIEQIAAETKINERYLHALENDRLDLLPGALYARNFVRSIARTIGADEEELIDYFNYQMRLQQDASGTSAPVVSRSRRGGALLATVGVAVALVIVLVALSLRGDDGDATGAAPAVATRTPARAGAAVPATPAGATLAPDLAVTAPATAPAGPTASALPTAARPVPPVLATAAGATAPEPAVQAGATGATGATGVTGSTGATGVVEGPAPTLRLAFTGGSWVEVSRPGQDGGEEFIAIGIKSRGDVVEVGLDQPVKLTIDNAANVSLSIDGQPGKPLGGALESRRFTIDRNNYRTFLK